MPTRTVQDYNQPHETLKHRICTDGDHRQAIRQNRVKRRTAISSFGLLSAASTLTAAASFLVKAPKANAKVLYKPPEITTTSSPSAVQLAKDMQSLNTTFYGAHWCSHCRAQKEVLGKEAFQMIRYVECAEDGVHSQRGLCKMREIPGYPTWEINGVLYPGEMDEKELRSLVDDILDEKRQSVAILARSDDSNVANNVAASADNASNSNALNSNAPANTIKNPQWAVNLLYDSECPVCMAEVSFLRSHDPHGVLLFTDIAKPDYDPTQPQNGGVPYEDAMERIHAVTKEGEVVAGVEVFRRTYGAIGLGWLFAISKIPIVGSVADGVYDTWALNRLRITGRPEVLEQLKRRKELRKAQCEDDIPLSSDGAANSDDPKGRRRCPSLT